MRFLIVNCLLREAGWGVLWGVGFLRFFGFVGLDGVERFSIL